jgi:hypothetical protein
MVAEVGKDSPAARESLQAAGYGQLESFGDGPPGAKKNRISNQMFREKNRVGRLQLRWAITLACAGFLNKSAEKYSSLFWDSKIGVLFESRGRGTTRNCGDEKWRQIGPVSL